MLALQDQTETQIQSDILITLRKMHLGFFWRNNNVGVYDKEGGYYRKPSKEFAMRGVSDILGCYKNRFAAIEVKTPESFQAAMRVYKKAFESGDVRLFRPVTKFDIYIHNQILFIDEVRRNGGIGFFTYGVQHTLEKLGAIDGQPKI